MRCVELSTEKRFTIVNMGLDGQYIKENGKIMTIERVVDLLNENEQLKQILNELSNMLQFDVENGIRSYPVKLSEYLSNALNELKMND